MSFTEKPSAPEWMNKIIHILDTNQLTFINLLHQILHYGHAFANLAPHTMNLVLNTETILELLFEVSADGLKQAVAKFIKKVYRDEFSILWKRHRVCISELEQQP